MMVQNSNLQAHMFYAWCRYVFRNQKYRRIKHNIRVQRYILQTNKLTLQIFALIKGTALQRQNIA